MQIKTFKFRKENKTMKEKLEKAKTFVKEHKKEILIGTGLVIAGGVIFVVTKKKPKLEDMKNFDWDKLPSIPDPKLKKLEVPETLLQKGVTEVSSQNPDKWFDIWTDGVPLSELGNFGKELSDTYDWKPNQLIRGVVAIGLNEEV